jgi:hypothetical protein
VRNSAFKSSSIKNGAAKRLFLSGFPEKSSEVLHSFSANGRLRKSTVAKMPANPYTFPVTAEIIKLASVTRV